MAEGVVSRVAIKFAAVGAGAVQQAYGKVQTGLTRSGNAAKRATQDTVKWMKANRKALLTMAGAATGFLAALIAASPTMRALMDGLRGAFTLFAESIIGAFGGEAIGKVIDFAFKLADAFNGLDPRVKKFIAAFVIAAGVLGGLALAIVGVIALIGGTAAIITGVLVVAIAAGIGILVSFKDQILNTFRVHLTNLKNAGIATWKFIKNVGAALLRGVLAFVDFVKEISLQLLEAAKKFGVFVADAWKHLQSLTRRAFRWGRDLVSNMIDGIKSMARRVKRAIDDILEPLTFDIVANDRMAQRWGRDAASHFTMGLQSGLPTPQAPIRSAVQAPVAAAMGGSRSTTIVFESGSVVLERNDVQSGDDFDLERFSETIADRIDRQRRRKS